MKKRKKWATIFVATVTVSLFALGCAKGSELDRETDPAAIAVDTAGGAPPVDQGPTVSNNDELSLARDQGTGGAAPTEPQPEAGAPQTTTTVVVITTNGGAAPQVQPTASAPNDPDVNVNITTTIVNGTGSTGSSEGGTSAIASAGGSAPVTLTGGSAPSVTGGTAAIPPPPLSGGQSPAATGGTPPVTLTGGEGGAGVILVGPTGGMAPLATGGTATVVQTGGTSPTGGTASQATGGTATGGAAQAPPLVDGPVITHIMPVGQKLQSGSETEIYACYISKRAWIQAIFKGRASNVYLKNFKFFRETTQLVPSEVSILGASGLDLTSGEYVSSDGIVIVRLAAPELPSDTPVRYSIKATSAVASSPSLLTIMDNRAVPSVAGPLASEGPFWGVMDGGTLVIPPILWTIEGDTYYTYGVTIPGAGTLLM